MNRMNHRFKCLSKDDLARMSKEEIIQRILSIMEHYTIDLKLFNDAYQMMKLYLEGQKSVHEARMLALSIHVKTHMIPMINYIKKYHEIKE